MTLSEIKQAVNAGKTVHWSNDNYVIICVHNTYNILCTLNNHSIGLTWTDGKTLNGEEHEFYAE